MVEICLLLARRSCRTELWGPDAVTYPVSQPCDLLDLELRLVVNVYQHPLTLFEFLHDTVVLCDQINVLLKGILVGPEISKSPSI